jgi:DNA polymerase-4
MDAFFASVEQRDFPHLRGQPVVVGATPAQRGVVAAASYEARQYGIRSAMPSFTARQRCPDVVFVPPRFEVYRVVSEQIRAIFDCYAALVEPLALDEAYLDVTVNPLGLKSATAIARQIKQQIWQETRLTASAGVSVNKFLAKVASGWNKPDGLWIVPPEAVAVFVAALPIEAFHGIGKVTAAKMHALGIRSGADLRRRSAAELVQHFGKVGEHYFCLARGQDDRAVTPYRPCKSIGAETSFARELETWSEVTGELEALARTLERRRQRHGVSGRTLTLKLKYADYQQIARSRTVERPIEGVATILQLAQALVPVDESGQRRVRLLGISLSNLTPVNGTGTAIASADRPIAIVDRPCLQLSLPF